MDVLNHECGHSLGRPHANFWNTGGKSAIGEGANQEYGNSFDVMGGGGGFTAHYNTISKRSLGWLPAQNTHNPTVSGVYRIFAYDQPVLEEGKRYGLRVPKDRTRGYNLEFHDNYGVEHISRVELRNSALVIWSGFGGAGHLIDTTPGTPAGKDDSGIEVGRTFSDHGAAVHFTILGRNATTPPSLDIALNFGNAATNLPPALQLAASATNVAVNGTLTFTATASDPNGDALAYQWDSGDGLPGTNTATFTRSFSAARQLTIHCTVSDMKGGVTRKHVIVNVGGSPRRAITGRVTTGGQPLQNVLLTGGGKYAYSDADGYYALSDLATGAATAVTPLLYGYSFNPNPGSVTVGNGVNNLNFIAMPLAQVSIAATAATTEGGASGSFAITRTGDIDSPLTVRVMSAAGTAARTTDYNFAPDYADDGNYRTFIVPAGAASVDVAVVPVNDGASEGPETVTLQLAEGTNYLVSAAGIATVLLQDDDTSLPQVSLTAADTEGSEAPGNVATITVSRTGPTTGNLNVALNYGGTATRGVDYPNLPPTITIPDGQSSVTMILAPLDDSGTEGSENATITLGSGAAYVLDTSAVSADLLILDDDIPVVTVSAVDASAGETDRDPGVFLVTRTGSTSAPLRVYYGLAGTALHGTDYIQLPAEITIPAGAASAPVVVTPYDDVHGERVETVLLRLTVFNGTYLVGSASSATLSITDNDDPGLLTVDSMSSTAGEPADTGRVRFHLTGSRTNSTTVHYTVSGTATPGLDYQALPGTIVLPPPVNGDSEVEIDLTPIDDALREEVETVIVTLLPDPAYVIYNGGTATLLLRDNDQPTVNVEAYSSAPAEPATASEFYISRTDAAFAEITAGTLSVNYTITGTAQNGVDYQSIAGTVVIPDGAAGVNIPVTPVDDALLEGSETIILTIDSSTAYSLGNDTDILHLTDNETHNISVGFLNATGSTTEAPIPATGEYRLLPVILSAPSANTITAEYVVGAASTAWADGIDWNLADAAQGDALVHRGMLTFPPGVTNQSVKIRVIPDNIIEGNENATVEIRNVYNARASGSRGTHTLTIVDDTAAYAPPRVLFITPASSVSEGAPVAPLLLAALDRPATTAASVGYTVTGGTATPGNDFTLAAGTLNFAPGETTKLLPLTLINDVSVESDETIVVTLSGPSGAQLGPVTAHTITILDNDSDAPMINVTASDASATEGGDVAAFAFTRVSGGAASALTVNYLVSGSASAGDDYTPLGGSVTIPAGQTAATLILSTIDDPDTEPNETVIVTIIPDPAYALGATVSATAVIVDDETQLQPPVAFSQTLFVPRNQPSALTLRGSDPSGDPLTYQIVTAPAHGTVTGLAPNVTYTPALNYTGPDSFNFRVTDGASTSSVATVSLTVFNATLVASNSLWRFNDLGADLGTAWLATNYTETGWGSGAARLGFGDAATTTLRGQPVITYYFRQKFVIPAGFAYSSLNLRVQRDDGVVVYLNGTEIVRDNMPGGAVAYSTRPNGSVGGVDESAWFNFGVNPGLLQTGTNLICAEVHQNDAASSDIGFALELTGTGSAESGPGATVIIATTDADATEPADSAAFTVTRVNGDTSADLSVSYVVSGSATPGADFTVPAGIVTIPAGQSSATITIVPLEDYDAEPSETVVLTLAGGPGYNLETNITAGATIADDDSARQAPTAWPQSVAVAMNAPASITLVATDVENDPLVYQILTPPGNGTLGGTPPNVIYTPNTGYAGEDSFAFRATDRGVWSAPAYVSINVFNPAVFITDSDRWRYHDGGVELGTAWRGTNYNDSGWSNGLARLGFGGDGEITTLRGQPVITYYFRKSIVVPPGYTVTNVTLNVQRDDGVVVYINGTEVVRDNMPAGTIAYTTRAAGNAPDETTWLNFPVAAALLRPGTNVVAAEVHQVNGTSSDAGFNLTLRGDGYFAAPAPAPRLAIETIPPDAVRLWFPASNGQRHAVDGSDDLSAWQPLGTNTTTGGLFQFTSQTTNPPVRFFRTRQVQ